MSARLNNAGLNQHLEWTLVNNNHNYNSSCNGLPTWFLVEENDGLTGRKGTVVVSLKRALWFCVASQTNDKWT